MELTNRDGLCMGDENISQNTEQLIYLHDMKIRLLESGLLSLVFSVLLILSLFMK